jgi:hypothetical protein
MKLNNYYLKGGHVEEPEPSTEDRSKAGFTDDEDDPLNHVVDRKTVSNRGLIKICWECAHTSFAEQVKKISQMITAKNKKEKPPVEINFGFRR